MPDPGQAAQRLEAVFSRIHRERMDGVPILNPRLRVEAVGTQSWDGRTLSVLITPWFINLMLLPETDEQASILQAVAPGTSVLHRFPAGRFDFIVGDEPELGRFEMCSLFSPVLEFEDHEAARLAAAAALEALFDASLDPAAEPKEKTADATTAGRDSATPAGERPATPVEPSRRGLLTGRIAPPREGSV